MTNQLDTEPQQIHHRRQVEDMYGWAEELCQRVTEAGREEVERFWAADGRMITNGALEADGIDSLLEHFRAVAKKYSRVTVKQPFHAYAEDGDHVTIEYEVLGDIRQGETAIATADTVQQHVRVIAIFTMRDGLIVEMREVAAANAGAH